MRQWWALQTERAGERRKRWRWGGRRRVLRAVRWCKAERRDCSGRNWVAWRENSRVLIVRSDRRARGLQRRFAETGSVRCHRQGLHRERPDLTIPMRCRPSHALGLAGASANSAPTAARPPSSCCCLPTRPLLLVVCLRAAASLCSLIPLLLLRLHECFLCLPFEC